MSQEVAMHNWLNHLSAASNYYSRLICKLESHYGLEVSRLDGNSFDGQSLNCQVEIHFQVACIHRIPSIKII